MTAATVAPQPVSPINVIGNLIFNVLAIATSVFAGPPVVPPGSTVTVHQSTLDIGDASATPAAAVPSTVMASAAPRAPPLIDAIGTLFFNVLSAVEDFATGPPTLPPGSTVTLDRSTLDIPAGDGITVPADWYFPNGAEPPTGFIYLQHGFLARGPMYDYTAANLAEQTNSIVVVPTLSSNFFAPDAVWLGGGPMQRGVADLFVGDREALTASASAAAGHPVTLPERFVIAGHSLGGGLAIATAGYTVDNGAASNLAGVLLYDPVALNNETPAAMAKLGPDIPVLAMTAPPYFWNQWGATTAALVAARPGQFLGVELAGASHVDFMQNGNPLIQLGMGLAAGFSQPQNVAAAQVLAVGWVNDWFHPDQPPTGIYAAPGQIIQIPTSAGTATATALPAPHAPFSPIDLLLQALIAAGQPLLFNFEPVDSAAPLILQTQELTQLDPPNAA